MKVLIVSMSTDRLAVHEEVWGVGLCEAVEGRQLLRWPGGWLQ